MGVGPINGRNNSLVACIVDGLNRSNPAVEVDKETYVKHPKTLALVSLPPYNGYIKAIKEHNMLAKFDDDTLFEMVCADIVKAINSNKTWNEEQKTAALDYFSNARDKIVAEEKARGVQVKSVYYDGYSWQYTLKIRGYDDPIMVQDNNGNGVVDEMDDKIFSLTKNCIEEVTQYKDFQELKDLVAPRILPLSRQAAAYVDEAARVLGKNPSYEWEFANVPQARCIKPALETDTTQLDKYSVKAVRNVDEASSVRDLFVYDYNNDKKVDAIRIEMKDGLLIYMEYTAEETYSKLGADGSVAATATRLCTYGVTGGQDVSSPVRDAISGLRTYLEQFDDINIDKK